MSKNISVQMHVMLVLNLEFCVAFYYVTQRNSCTACVTKKTHIYRNNEEGWKSLPLLPGICDLAFIWTRELYALVLFPIEWLLMFIGMGLLLAEELCTICMAGELATSAEERYIKVTVWECDCMFTANVNPTQPWITITEDHYSEHISCGPHDSWYRGVALHYPITMISFSARGVSWPSGLVHRTQVLVLSENQNVGSIPGSGTCVLEQDN